MRTMTACAALLAASLAACQPAAEGTETADAGAAPAAEGAAVEASASGGDMLEARVREGLWRTTISSEAMPTMSARMCMDETMSALDTSAADEVGDCAQTITRTADGFNFRSRCESGESTVTETTGSLTGDFQTAYRMEATTTTTGSSMADGTISMVTEATYEGPCPDDWRPGDMEIPGGMRVNILDAQAQAEAAMAGSPPS